MKLEIPFALIGLIFSLPSTIVFSQTGENTETTHKPPLQIAVMPFCNESNIKDTTFRFDPNKIYNRSINALRTLGDCHIPLAVVSKNRASRILLSHSGDSLGVAEEAYCDRYLSEAACKEFEADILVLGEYIINPDQSVEVYYSFENCDGIYHRDIDYLTAQPITGTLDYPEQLYVKIAGAIAKDIEAYAGCQQKLDVNSILAEGNSFYQQGDSLQTAYLMAIQKFNMILQVDPGHQKALYHLGLSHLAIDQFSEAKVYFERAADYEDARDYITYCSMNSHPANWYDTHFRRKGWWNELSDAWKSIFLKHVFKLSPNQEPSDEQLKKLFSLNVLSFENIRLPDISGIEALTNLTQLTLSKTRLSSLNGIEKVAKTGTVVL